MLMHSRQIGSLMALIAVAILKVSAAGTEEKIIPATEAAKHIGKVCTVEFVVKSTGSSRKDKLVFLNSAPNFRFDNNFAVVFEPTIVEQFKEFGIDDIERHYFGKRIRVTGTLRHFKSMTDMKMDSPQHIRIVESSPPEPIQTETPAPAPVTSPRETPPAASPLLEGASYYYVIGAGAVALLAAGYLLGRVRKPSQPSVPAGQDQPVSGDGSGTLPESQTGGK
jgi:hypothetical protein